MNDEKSCGCIVINDGKVLLVGAKDDSGHMFWGFPKGHQITGETDIETALRETHEETGLDVAIISPKSITTSHPIKNGMAQKHIVLFLAEPSDKNQPITLQPDEIEQYIWVPFANTPQYLSDYYIAAWAATNLS